MTEIVESQWINITAIDDEYEVEYDVASDLDAPETVRFRFRPKAYSGEFQYNWQKGCPPKIFEPLTFR